VPPPLQQRLLALAQSGSWWPAAVAADDPSTPARHFSGRVFFTAEASVPAFDRCCSLIRVPPLRVRRQDLGEWVRYGVRQRSRKLGWPSPPQVPEAVVKRLQSYDFPNNHAGAGNAHLPRTPAGAPSGTGDSPPGDVLAGGVARRRVLDGATAAALPVRHLALEASS